GSALAQRHEARDEARARCAREGDDEACPGRPRVAGDVRGRRLRRSHRALRRRARQRSPGGLRVMKLEQRIALVTGAAKGMGYDICLTLAREGADLAL